MSKNRVKEMYRDLKGTFSKQDYVSENAIKNGLSVEALYLLEKHGYIKYCTTIQGNKIYAI